MIYELTIALMLANLYELMIALTVKNFWQLLTFSASQHPPSDQSLREIADVHAAWPSAVLKELVTLAVGLLHPLRARRRALTHCLNAMERLASTHGLPPGLVESGDWWRLHSITRENEESEESKECVMCMEHCRQVRFDECGHAVLCYPCFQQLLAVPAPLCPVCGVPVATAAAAPDDDVARQATYRIPRGGGGD